MHPDDQQSLSEYIAKFLDGSGIDPPFHLVAIGANGAVSVSHHTDSGIEEVCATPGGGLVAPITLTVIAPDGRGKSAKI